MKYLFGPVPSRRLGYSLGIDMVPSKVCTFDCVYCEVGKTTKKTITRTDFKNAEEIIAETKEFLENYKGRIDHISFSGSGEPTLNIKLGYIASEIRKITSIPLALITNSALFYLEDVRREAIDFDAVLPSLDAVIESSFQEVNKPHKDLNLQKIIDGLIDFSQEYKGHLLLEILFVKGINDSKKDLISLRKVIEKMKVEKIQINTVIRPPAYASSMPIDESDKQMIKSILGDIAELELVFKSNEKNESDAGDDDVMNLLLRRPCTFEQISTSLGISVEKLKLIVEGLEKKEKIRVDKFGNEFYYSVQK